MDSHSYNVVMFAHNEEKKVQTSIKSILSNVDVNLAKFYVIANGCTDKTEAIINDISKVNDKVVLISLTIGDKCNAWNTYIHEIATDVDMHFFVDADVSFTEQVFAKMANTLFNSKEAIAIAGLPFSGRHKEFYRGLVIDGVCLFGNCYGIRQEFIHLAREKKFKLPIGLGWIDSIITKAINCNITNQYKTVDNRITHDLSCGYTFESLKFYNLDDIKLYISRISRYTVGKLQEQELNKLEFSEYPSTLSNINQKILNDIQAKKSKVPFYLKKTIIKRLKKQLKVS
jgi:glycosyltransferase involved in cell wall biosynthesis